MLGATSIMLREYRLYTQDSLLSAVLGGLYGMSGIESKSASCKTNALLVLSLQSPISL